MPFSPTARNTEPHSFTAETKWHVDEDAWSLLILHSWEAMLRRISPAN